jgi:hypothetical protein
MANFLELLVQTVVRDALSLSKNTAGGVSEALRNALERTAGELNAIVQAQLSGDAAKVAEHRRNVEHLVGQCRLALAMELDAAVASGANVVIGRILETVLPLLTRLGGIR